MVAKVNSTVSAPQQNYSERISHVATKASEMAKRVSQVAFEVVTNPFFVYGLTSTAVIYYASEKSLLGAFLVSAGSTLLGAGAAVGATVAHLKWMSSRMEAPTEEAPVDAAYPVIAITQENFKAEVLDSKVPVILDAYATWCSPCKRVAPIFAELSEELEGKIKFVKMNVDQEKALAQEMGVQAMPTFLLFKDGKIVGHEVGAMQKEGFLQAIAKHFI